MLVKGMLLKVICCLDQRKVADPTAKHQPPRSGLVSAPNQMLRLLNERLSEKRQCYYTQGSLCKCIAEKSSQTFNVPMLLFNV